MNYLVRFFVYVSLLTIMIAMYSVVNMLERQIEEHEENYIWGELESDIMIGDRNE